jgi:hypothetical protein
LRVVLSLQARWAVARGSRRSTVVPDSQPVEEAEEKEEEVPRSRRRR